MSLINDALKKAQRQRTEGSTPATEITPAGDTQEPLQRVARRAKPVGFRSQLILIGGGAAAAVLLLGVGAFFLFRPAAETATPSAQPDKIASAPAVPATAPATPAAPIVVSPATPTEAPTTPPAPVQVVAAPVSSAPAPVAVETTAPTTPASAPVAFSIPTAAATASAPVATPAPAVVAPAAVERPKPSTRMVGVIEHMKVGGIRVAGAESKVLMNDRVYRINDIVDFELGIRLTAIEAKALTFEDGRGAVHVRTF